MNIKQTLLLGGRSVDKYDPVQYDIVMTMIQNADQQEEYDVDQQPPVRLVASPDI